MPRRNLMSDYKSSTISSDYISSDEEEIEDDFLKKILEKTAIIKLQIKELKNKHILSNDQLDYEQFIKSCSSEQLVEYYNNIIKKLNEQCQEVLSLKDTTDLIRRELKKRKIISDTDKKI